MNSYGRSNGTITSDLETRSLLLFETFLTYTLGNILYHLQCLFTYCKFFEVILCTAVQQLTRFELT